MNDELPGINPGSDTEQSPPKKTFLCGEQVHVFNGSLKALDGGLICRIATLPHCGLKKIFRALIVKRGKEEKPVMYYECMNEEKLDLELLSLLKSQYSGKWSQKLNMSRSDCIDLIVNIVLSRRVSGMVIYRADLATDGMINCIFQIRRRVEHHGYSFGLIFGEQVSDEYAANWRSRISDATAQASFALSGLDLSGLLGYMGKTFPEAIPFIKGFKRGHEKYVDAAHELYSYAHGRTDVLDNFIQTVKTFFPGKQMTLEILSAARAILAQPSLLLTPHGIEADRK